jgi:nitrite reductase/ring-hydroxylating ferredoxin subunit
MAKCDQCDNDYDKSFEITTRGQTHTFDSFECAIQALAPVCPHCGCKIIGHGVEEGGAIYCCAHCAGKSGATGVSDRA